MGIRKNPEVGESDIPLDDWSDFHYPDSSVTSVYPITLEEFRRRENNQAARATRPRKGRVSAT